MKHNKYALIIIIFILTNNFSSVGYSNNKIICNPTKDPFFSPENITLADDAFHQSNRLFHIETWYFDATFSNNESLVIVTCLFKTKHTGLFLHGVYLYNQSKLIYQQRRITPLQSVILHQNRPFIKIKNDLIIDGYIDNRSGMWIYDISIQNSELSAQLTLTKEAEGWKGNHLLGWWLAIPRFSVHGTICYQQSTVSVSGLGYHDHNMYPVYIPFLVDGYHFGSISAESLQLTWARLIKNKQSSQLIGILNQNDLNFSLIDEKDIVFTIEETMIDHAERIPKIYSITIENDQMFARLTMKTIDVHFIRILGVKYWRYHLHIWGSITRDNSIETIDSVQFAELLTFF